ncbi:GNAT family N-acetyltransferase [Algoriphagus terrigena]|uniref:GNAT family N-acetyltransferase n=1 Tax=Algoriphagus terrigena TaxID=344884 RepID=UPI0004013B2D|nr:GNAT family N-acetyltransferase [Algoriphagus terrigena]
MITLLPFDSDLFGYPVGKATISGNWDEISFLEEAKAFQLVYVSSESALPVNCNSFRLVDVKVTFAKDLVKTQPRNHEIYRWEGELIGNLVQLALESGAFSRFKTDPRLVQGEFEKLYRLWIEKAWEKRQIFCSPNLEAMVTVSSEDKLAKIGLLAVNFAHRNQGWGRKLVHAAEHYALLLGVNQIQIPTQQTNFPACNLYQSLGYQLQEQTHLYHWWRDFSPALSNQRR